MKFGQLIEYNKGDIFLQNWSGNKAKRVVPDLFLLFKKALYEVKASVCCLVWVSLDSLQLGIQ